MKSVDCVQLPPLSQTAKLVPNRVSEGQATSIAWWPGGSLQLSFPGGPFPKPARTPFLHANVGLSWVRRGARAVTVSHTLF